MPIEMLRDKIERKVSRAGNMARSKSGHGQSIINTGGYVLEFLTAFAFDRWSEVHRVKVDGCVEQHSRLVDKAMDPLCAEFWLPYASAKIAKLKLFGSSTMSNQIKGHCLFVGSWRSANE